MNLNLMRKKNLIVLIVFLVLVVIATLFFSRNKSQVYAPTADFKNATYEIEGNKITLRKGFAQTEVSPDSVSRINTEYFGNEAFGDLNLDGFNDVAFLITQDSGGSGIFFYAVVALGGKRGYLGTNAIFLGDRIAPQTTEIKDGKVIVNFAERGVGEPMSNRPSVGVSKYLRVLNSKLIEIKAI
jgi:hypothetical protein